LGDLTENLNSIADKIRADLLAKDSAREKALPLCRDVIRYSGRSIRALHRQEFDKARDMLGSAGKLVGDAKQHLAEYCELQHSRFILDAQKEFAEASITLTLITKQKLPDPDELGVDYAAYLNGLGEAIGEVRRYILDSLRKGDLYNGFSRCHNRQSASYYRYDARRPGKDAQ